MCGLSLSEVEVHFRYHTLITTPVDLYISCLHARSTLFTLSASYPSATGTAREVFRYDRIWSSARNVSDTTRMYL